METSAGKRAWASHDCMGSFGFLEKVAGVYEAGAPLGGSGVSLPPGKKVQHARRLKRDIPFHKTDRIFVPSEPRRKVDCVRRRIIDIFQFQY